MFILMLLVYYMYLFMPKYKKRTYLLEIDPLFTLGVIGGTKTNPSLFYTTQKEESLVQPHNIINDCICSISWALFSYWKKRS